MTATGFFLNVNKPTGTTSRDVVDVVVRAARTRRVGHAGTLDPLASGVLVIAVEKATRLIEYVQQQTKTYEAEFQLGVTSETDDSESELMQVEGNTPPTKREILDAFPPFLGTIEQRPPSYSAVKVAGQRAYRLARKGKEVVIAARPVVIHRLELLSYEYPRLSLRVVCGSGTYIRSLARDLGEKLGTGGVMTALRRTAVGVFHSEDSISLEELGRPGWRERARPYGDALVDLDRVEVNEEEAKLFRTGRPFRQGTDRGEREYAVYCAGQFLGISSSDFRPIKGGFA
ncbi:MAG: tRNA pseudouridine(55) synthase TruB [Planctomycetota bacterium]